MQTRRAEVFDAKDLRPLCAVLESMSGMTSLSYNARNRTELPVAPLRLRHPSRRGHHSHLSIPVNWNSRISARSLLLSVRPYLDGSSRRLTGHQVAVSSSPASRWLISSTSLPSDLRSIAETGIAL